MYKRTENQIMISDDFFLPFGGKLNRENRWVKMAEIIPWLEVEEKYMDHFCPDINGGQQAFHIRIALGSLIIQEKEGLSDSKTVAAITENPYMQFFIGLPKFQEKPPFDPSLMVHFRKRLGKDIINEVNRMIIARSKKEPPDNQNGGGNGDSEEVKNNKEEKEERQGSSILDATCTPADVHYPTDLWLLNESREHLEEMIDTLHAPQRGKMKKPRDYREKARRTYLSIEKQRKPGYKKIRKSIGQQLRFIRRDLYLVAGLVDRVGMKPLSRYQQKSLRVIHEIYRQQELMYRNKVHKVDDRIVNIAQPHVRPIVRGKTSAEVEFGAKLAVSIVDGFVEMETLSWDAFNEGTTMIESIERYKRRYGCYPKVVIADKIYRNRDNLNFCKKNGIRLSGPKLGRPKEEELKEQLRLERIDSKQRNAVEGKFGEGKRFYGLGRIRAHLLETSESVIALDLLVLNLEKRLRLLLWHFFRRHILEFWAGNAA